MLSNLSSVRKNARREYGIVLIFVAGILAILVALGTAFYALTSSSTQSSIRYSDMVRADLLARAGIADAIARLRSLAYLKPEDPSDTWYTTDYLRGAKKRISFPFGDGKDNAPQDGIVDNEGEPGKAFTRALGASVGEDSDRYTVEVTDASSKININACDNLAVVLDNLCRLIGPPLKPADLDMIQPYRWFVESNNTLSIYGYNSLDTGTAVDHYYLLDPDGRPVRDNKAPYEALLRAAGRAASELSGQAVFGDGYAIAGFRSRNGRFTSLEQVKQALTFVDRNGTGTLDDPLEFMEVEAKFAALKPHLTTGSWVDTNTVSVGKFEWVSNYHVGPPIAATTVVVPVVRNIVTDALEVNVPCQLLIDRDKSWVADDPVGDPKNERGSLRGSYVAIVNGHGAGQLRRIATNGIDWIALRGYGSGKDESMVVPPGPISSYMIIAREDAKLYRPTNSSGVQLQDSNGSPLYLPETDANGQFVDDPNIDYERFPLCIHRAPVNINTATDKVLAALLMGINVTHGNFMAVGTDADMSKLAGGKSRWAWNGDTDPDWKINDYDDPARNPYRKVEPYILTPKGLKRIPGSKGQPIYDVDWNAGIKPSLPAGYDMDYIGNNGSVDPAGSGRINEAQELAFRILIARQPDSAFPYLNPANGVPVALGNEVYKRQPFRSWDDLYFRVIRPWDDARLANPKKGSVARLIMANLNSNLDILKFNPNIEWIDRFGRNFTEMEPIMVYTNNPEVQLGASYGHGQIDSEAAKPQHIVTCDQDGVMYNTAIPVFTRERSRNWPNFTAGVFGTDPVMNGTYVVRSYRYKADEMIDKTDLNRSTTELVFDSNGVFHIASSGQVINTVTGQLLSERKLESLVKVYDVWRETTQRQFVNGYIMRAAGQPGTPDAGSVGRDVSNVNSRLSLTTMPEPLVPQGYRILNNRNREVVDTTLGQSDRKRDAWGNVVTDMTLPDSLSNFVQPAGYDGQIVLATNTLRYDSSRARDADSFLASFNGDLDTDTCRGNGREQAKTPLNCRVRVLDTCSILGLLDDRQIDTDPGLRGDTGSTTAMVADLPVTAITDGTPASQRPAQIWRYNVALNCLRGLDPRYYWNNVICRQGDLRTDGVWVGGPGVAGNEGVFKYLCGHDGNGYSDDLNFTLNGRGAVRATGEDAGAKGDSGNVNGCLVTMWAKTAWHHNDGRNHEFFDVSTPGWADNGTRSEAFYFRKQGRTQWAVMEKRRSGNGTIQITNSNTDMVPGEDETWGISGSGNRTDDLSLCLEPTMSEGAGVWSDWSEPDWPIYLHGGVSGVPENRMPRPANLRPNPGPESPAYRIQPFRWQYLGARIFLKRDWQTCNNYFPPQPTVNNSVPSGWREGKSGFWKRTAIGGNPWSRDPNSVWVAGNLFRPFIDSERWPDSPGGADYQPWGKYWCVVQPQGSAGFAPYQTKGRAGDVAARGDGGQHVRWRWASPGGTATNSTDGRSDISDFTVFGVNNANPGFNYMGSGSFCSIYRNAPDEGTMAVIDEYKISLKETTLRNPPDWNADRVTRGADGEMTLSRYYTPTDPTDPRLCPTFTSQTLLQSIRGFNRKTSPTPQYVTLARVSWNVFTPRFMLEYKRIGRARNESVTLDGWTDYSNVNSGSSWCNAPTSMNIPFRGPFDYRIYNNIINLIPPLGTGEFFEEFDDVAYDNNATVFPFRCLRPTPAQYRAVVGVTQTHASRGVEVELLEDVDEDPGNNNEAIRAGPFHDPAPYLPLTDAVSGSSPNTVNAIGTAMDPVRVRADRLRYRVRFRYHRDPLADRPGEMSVAEQYVLDTPVFDDISVAYFDRLRILDYHEVSE